MTSASDDLIRAFLADEARRASAAGPSLDEAVGRLAPRIGGRPSGASRRLIVLLAATLLLVAALGTAIAVGSGLLRLPLVIDASTVSPFHGAWVSNSDADGGTQTMTVRVSADDAVEITVRDDVATVCGGTPSTMTGTGRIEGGTQLVIPAPVYTCDDRSEPDALSGPPLAEQLRDWTLILDPRTDTLSDGAGSTWLREGSEAPSPDPTPTGRMWPQTSLAEVNEAQDRADAGDPAYTWQVDPLLASDEGRGHLEDPGTQIVERFLREELGWGEFVYDVFQDQRGPVDSAEGAHRGIVFLRCAVGETNPLYPAGRDQLPGARCAPTIDELRYETVTLDIAQLGRHGPDGIWVVSGWRMTEPFTQADPRIVEAEATAHLEGFLRARIAGENAEGYLSQDVPLLYSTTAGAPYERFEIERVSDPRWPYGGMDFMVRLFADGGETVVEQPISREHDGFVEGGGLPRTATLAYFHLPWETTENGRPVAVPYHFLDGTVSASAAAPWLNSLHFDAALARDDQALERVALTVDSVRISCHPNPRTSDVAALAATIQSDPDLVATASVEVTIGGLAGVGMDLTLAPGASACPDDRKGDEPNPADRIRGTGFPLEQASRMRLYLLDLPEGSAPQILAIAIAAPDARFETVLEAATPIIESIEWLGAVDLATGDALPEDLRDFLTVEFGLALDDAAALGESFETLETVEVEISRQRSQWSEAAEIRAYLGRRTADGGQISTDQIPVRAVVWVVEISGAELPRPGEDPGTVDRVILMYDAETGEEVAYFESATNPE